MLPVRILLPQIRWLWTTFPCFWATPLFLAQSVRAWHFAASRSLQVHDLFQIQWIRLVGRQDVSEVFKSSTAFPIFLFVIFCNHISSISWCFGAKTHRGPQDRPVRKSSHQFSIFSDNFPDSLATEESTRLWQRLLLQATAKCLKHCRRGTPCESFARMKIPGSAASWVLFKPSTLWTKWNSHGRIVQTDSKPF